MSSIKKIGKKPQPDLESIGDEEVEDLEEDEDDFGLGEIDDDDLDDDLMIDNEDDYDPVLVEDDLEDEDIVSYTEINKRLEDSIEEHKDISKLKESERPFKFNKFLTKYERARIIGNRAAQLAHNAPPLISLIDPNDPRRQLKDPIEIAEQELKQRKLPLMIRRPIPSPVMHKPMYIDIPLSELII